MIVLASAFLSTASTISSSSSDVRAQARTAVAEYATCMVRRENKIARMMVLDQWSLGRINVAENLRTRVCLPAAGSRTGIRFRPEHLRWAVADALIAAEPHLELGNLTAKPLLPLVITERLEDPNISAEERTAVLQNMAMSRFGECLVRAAPTDAGALVRSKLGSFLERGAIKRLEPAMRGCVVKDVRYTMNAQSLRGTVAENFYRLAKSSERTTRDVSR